MEKSKFVKANKKIIEGVTTGYKKIEDAVADAYEKVESTVVEGYERLEDTFVEKFLIKDGESVEEAKERLKKNEK